MVFIRGPHPEASIWRHFRGEGDGFTFGEREGVSEAMVMANADRIVELFLALAEFTGPPFEVADPLADPLGAGGLESLGGALQPVQCRLALGAVAAGGAPHRVGGLLELARRVGQLG